jgi:uncharacterized protein (DUF983 family)
MADETTPTTNPTAPGGETSEGKLTKYIQIFCGVLVVAAGALTGLQTQFPNIIWLQVAATLVAGLVSLLTQLGFVKSRTIIKAEMISAASPQNPK